ncbi:MAG TPA: hypothetical protein VIY48_16720 [Candidatus Paceibacterota bacterium]
MHIASVITRNEDLRSEIEGYTHEDSSLLVRRSYKDEPGIFIGYTPGANFGQYKCVLEMLADGWKLLGPPSKEAHFMGYGWCWWLTREG